MGKIRLVVPLAAFLLVTGLSAPERIFAPAPSAAQAQGLIRNLIAKLRGEPMPEGVLKASGVTQAAEVDVSSRVPGRVRDIAVEEGDRVSIGQTIAVVVWAGQDVALVSPRSGEVRGLAAAPGDTVAANEPIATIVDLTDVYLSVFLPSAKAIKVRVGDEARVILDAAPDYVIPAAVSFVASEAQLSPKSIETKAERADQTLRVDLRIDPQVLKTYAGKEQTGLRGEGFVRANPAAKWPEELAIKLPAAPVAEERPAPPAPAPQEPVNASPAVTASATPPAATSSAQAPAAPAQAPAETAAPAPAPAAPAEASSPKPAAPTAAGAASTATTTSAEPPAPTPPAASAEPPAPAAPAAGASTASAAPVEAPIEEFAPEKVAQLFGAWAPSLAECDKLFQRKGRTVAYRQPIDRFARGAIVEPQRIRLPSATCQLESAARDGGALKLIAECADTISYTSRTAYVKLRSNGEVVFSATGDPVLASNLTKCPL